MGGSFGICELKNRYIAGLAGFDRLRIAVMMSSKATRKPSCDSFMIFVPKTGKNMFLHRRP